MIFLITFPPIIISACNIGLKNIPFSKEVFKQVIGIPFNSGDEIMPLEVKESTDLPRFEKDNKYCVAPKCRLTVISSVGGFYDEDRKFQIFDNLLASYLLRELQIPTDPFITHYFMEGRVHNTISRKDIETTFYVPIEAVHGKFQLTVLT